MFPGSLGFALDVGRISGIPVSVHWSLLALMGGKFVYDVLKDSPLGAVVFLVASGLCVLCILCI